MINWLNGHVVDIFEKYAENHPPAGAPLVVGGRVGTAADTRDAEDMRDTQRLKRSTREREILVFIEKRLERSANTRVS